MPEIAVLGETDIYLPEELGSLTLEHSRFLSFHSTSGYMDLNYKILSRQPYEISRLILEDDAGILHCLYRLELLTSVCLMWNFLYAVLLTRTHLFISV